jgi:S-adenosylmethionine synthetase
VQVSYAIEMSKLLSIFVDSYGTRSIPDNEILELNKMNFDFKLGMITINLDLNRGGNEVKSSWPSKKGRERHQSHQS